MCRQIICKWVIMGGVNTTKLDHQVCRLMFSFFFPATTDGQFMEVPWCLNQWTHGERWKKRCSGGQDHPGRLCDERCFEAAGGDSNILKIYDKIIIYNYWWLLALGCFWWESICTCDYSLLDVDLLTLIHWVCRTHVLSCSIQQCKVRQLGQ